MATKHTVEHFLEKDIDDTKLQQARIESKERDDVLFMDQYYKSWH